MSDYEINSENNDIEPDENAMSKTTEEPLGNVSDFAAEPVGFNGEKRKGILIFDANFESGNLGRVDLINEFEYDLFVRPDTCNARLLPVIFSFDRYQILREIRGLNLLYVDLKRSCCIFTTARG